MNQKGIIGVILTISILLVGIAIAVYLIQFTQVFKPKASGTQTVFYVSPNGNDTNDGSIASPFKTIDKARQAIRTINKTATTDIFVYIKKGTYELNTSLVFDGDDSGFNGHYIRYISETPADRPLIHGGKIVTGWIQEGNKWKVNIGTSPIRQLYVNNKRVDRARTRGGFANFQTTANGLIYSDDRFAGYPNPEDIEVVINNAFLQYRCRIQNVVGTAINMKKPCWDSTFAFKITPQLPQPIYLENHAAFLENPATPGEWFHNIRTGDLYYLPKQGEQITNTTIVAPVLEKLIEGKGTASNPVQNIVFENLDFAYATWLEPTTKGYIGLQGVGSLKNADYILGNAPLPGSINFSQAKGIWLIRNGFYHLGAAAVNFERGSKNNFIVGNVFEDISAHAVFLGDNNAGIAFSNPPESEMTDGNQIYNNYIHNTGVEYHESNAIYVGYSKNTNIYNNTIFDVPYSGISMAQEAGGGYSANNSISRNLVYDLMKGNNMYDGGAVYVKGLQPNSKIIENVLHNQHNLVSPIYLDNNSEGFYISKNILYDNQKIVQNSPYGTWGVTVSARGCKNVFEGNFWESPGADSVLIYSHTPSGDPCSNGGDNINRNNTTITSVTQAPQNIVAAAGLEATYQDIKNFPAPLLPTTTTSSPIPSPSPGSVKPGDVDGDGDVDIFDFNLVITNFGKTNDPNTKADLDNDDDVDIFDYNLILTNFGK